MNAITMLTEDHRAVTKLLDELEATTERGVKTRTELYDRIKQMLTVHEVIEEEIFYQPSASIRGQRTSSSKRTRSTTSSTRS